MEHRDLIDDITDTSTSIVIHGVGGISTNSMLLSDSTNP